MIKARTPDPDEPKSRRPIEIGEIGISDGTLYIEDKSRSARHGRRHVAVRAIERLDASLGVKSNEDELTVDDRARVAARARRRRSASTRCPA